MKRDRRYYGPFKARIFGAQRSALSRWWYGSRTRGTRGMARKLGLRRPRSDAALIRLAQPRRWWWSR